MDSQPQARQMMGMNRRHLSAQALRRRRVFIEYHRGTFAKPGDYLAGCCKPCTPNLEILDQFAITPVPQPLRSDAAIMPVNGDAASVLRRMVGDSPNDEFRLLLR